MSLSFNEHMDEALNDIISTLGRTWNSRWKRGTWASWSPRCQRYPRSPWARWAKGTPVTNGRVNSDIMENDIFPNIYFCIFLGCSTREAQGQLVLLGMLVLQGCRECQENEASPGQQVQRATGWVLTLFIIKAIRVFFVVHVLRCHISPKR